MWKNTSKFQMAWLWKKSLRTLQRLVLLGSVLPSWWGMVLTSGHSPGENLRGQATDTNNGRAVLRTESRWILFGSSWLNEIQLVHWQGRKTEVEREELSKQQTAQKSEIHAWAGRQLLPQVQGRNRWLCYRFGFYQSSRSSSNANTASR